MIHGLHGRRRSGSGENFWQFRRFVSGEEARCIDWRRSARDDNLYVREREWEAAHTIWLWPDRSPSMARAWHPVGGDQIAEFGLLPLVQRAATKLRLFPRRQRSRFSAALDQPVNPRPADFIFPAIASASGFASQARATRFRKSIEYGAM